MFLTQLAQSAVDKCGLTKVQPILLGVSGGADSLALMHGLDVLGYEVVVAHVDHGLRDESLQEADFVRLLAVSRGLPFYSQRVDVQQIADKENQSVEEAARNVRYQFLFEQARRFKCQAVAVAHHADDQVETIFMHLMRGAALSGLTGMPYRRLMSMWDKNIPLVRPLLGFWRDEIDAYIEQIGLTPCDDRSNLDMTYHRNRIRHELIPGLKNYNPKIKSVIWRMADVLREEEQFLDEISKQTFDSCQQTESNDRVILYLSKFNELPKALRRRVLRHAIAQLCPDLRDVGFEVIERGLTFAQEGASGREMDLVARLNLVVIDDALIINPWQAELPDLGQPSLLSADEQSVLDLGHPLYLRFGQRIEASLLESPPKNLMAAVMALSSKEAWLDYDRINLPLVVRARQGGDRFKPLGMGGQSQSLQDFFVNCKVAEPFRRRWPLVISGDEIAWVVQIRPSETFKIRDTTQRILKLGLVEMHEDST
jgi:tRNA(Ile)-lysidine synthase